MSEHRTEAKRLEVRVSGQPAGTLYKDDDHEYRFRYTTEDPILFVSLTMPVRSQDYATQVLPPPFQMNLPEGYNLEALRRKFAKVSDLDDMDLLAMSGESAIGRVSVVSSGQSAVPLPQIDAGKLMRNKNALALLDSLIIEQPTLGVSGMQPKYMAREGAPRMDTLRTATHIYKSSHEYPGVAVNEYFCMKCAAAAGITVPALELSDDGTVLKVERFDVAHDGARLGVEEAVVLMGMSREGKYRASYEDMCAQLLRFVNPMKLVETAEDLLCRVVSNVLIRNGDAHLKNFAVIYSGVSDVRLSPAYDMLTTTVYIKGDVMALTLLGGKDWPSRPVLLKFAVTQLGIPNRRAVEVIGHCARATRATLDELAKFGRENEKYKDLCERMSVEWNAALAQLESTASMPESAARASNGSPRTDGASI